jgi:hypothetical protein
MKPFIRVRQFDGTLVEEKFFESNQAMYDYVVKFMGRPLDVDVFPEEMRKLEAVDR